MVHQVRRLSFYAAALCLLLAATRADHVVAQSIGCPCSIWTPSATPANPAVTDGQPIEVGTKFRSDVDGFVTALRFYKGASNTGVHEGHLWSATGALLATATFTNESAAGWQEVALPSPVTITANQTYIASYHSDSGFFAIDSGFFSATGVDSPPLHAPQAGVDGPNGVFLYGASGFPSAGGTNNYWVDVVLQTDLGPDTTPPVILSSTPAPNATGVPLSTTVKAAFNEAIEPASLTSATFALRDQAGAAVPASVGWDAGTRTATLATTAGLLAQTTYTATVSGGVNGVRDLAGNALASDDVWSFTTGAAAPPADEGPGGPILVISSSSNPFGRYYAEILRAEGLNEFTATDISLVTSATLAQYDVAILGEMPLTPGQVTMLTDWVASGGNLIAMRPDKQLAGLLGLSDQSATLANAYLKVNTAAAPGAGIVSDTMQFHGTADRYVTAGASTIATLFSDDATATPNPAVSIAAVGAMGGQAAAFSFDLARSVVYTRQGNPAWSGQERDGISPIRSDDLFFGAAAGDVRPDWVDLNKVAIPQADEQQRLLANLVLHLNRARKPLPRFWYLPRGAKAALVMTGDDHGNGGTVGRFNQYKALSAPGCSVGDWQCIRSTSYIYNGTPGMDDGTSLGFANDGFEVALHVTTNCGNWTPGTLATFYAQQLAQFRADRPSVPPIQTNRTHCIVWSDYVTQPKVELANGIRFDTNYYFYPPNWVQDRPGLFTGSAMPMRFADLDGGTIDVYQATTQMTDESGQTYPFTSDTLLDRALGPLGYYGVFTANMHTDAPTEQQSDAAVQSAITRGVPVVSAKQMLDWLDGRNGSSFGSVAFTDGTLTFSVSAAAGSNGLTAMVPAQARGGALLGISRDGSPVSYTTQVIKGVPYAFFDGVAGNYTATYAVDVTAPVISGVTATPGLNDTATLRWNTDEPANSRVDYGVSATSLTSHATDASFTLQHAITLALAPRTTYFYEVTSSDAAGNTATSAIASFTTPATQFAATDTTAADFGAGTSDGQVYISQTADGELMLTPAAGSEFSGTALPSDWPSTAWNPGGTATVSNGALVVDGAKAGTVANFAAGRSLEFVATFSGSLFQHVGFADTLDAAPWAIFSTSGGGALFARTNAGSTSIDTPLTASLLGSPHRFRIDWTASGVIYSVDGTVVASHAVAITAPMRPLVSDVAVGSGSVSVNWVRMSPYAAAATFISRVFDAGQAADWGGLSWTAETPAGTSAAFFARHGETAVPDTSWSAFSAVAQPGGAIGGRSRYVQYRVDLASSDASVSPAIDDVTVGYAVVPPNHPPVAADDSYSGAQDNTFVIAAPGVLANDSDADGDALSAVLVAPPAHGALTLGADGGFTYSPTAGYSGGDSFTYTANDAKDASAPATVTITIVPAALPPQVDVTASGDRGSPSTTVRTATFSTTNANDLLLAFVSVDGPPPGGGKTTVTKVTGGGLTWQLVARANAQLGGAEVWSAFAPAILTNVSVTATLSRSFDSSLTVVSFKNAGGVGAIKTAGASSGAPGATLVTTKNNSLIFGVGNDWDHAVARTPVAGQALVHQYLAPVDDTYWVQRVSSAIPASGTSVTLGDAAPTSDRWNLAVVEVVPPQ